MTLVSHGARQCLAILAIAACAYASLATSCLEEYDSISTSRTVRFEPGEKQRAVLVFGTGNDYTLSVDPPLGVLRLPGTDPGEWRNIDPAPSAAQAGAPGAAGTSTPANDGSAWPSYLWPGQALMEGIPVVLWRLDASEGETYTVTVEVRASGDCNGNLPREIAVGIEELP